MDEVVIVDAETSVDVAVVMVTLVPVEEEEISVVVTEVVVVVEASVATVVVEGSEEIEVEAFEAAAVVSRALASSGKCKLGDTLKCMLT